MTWLSIEKLTKPRLRSRQEICLSISCGVRNFLSLTWLAQTISGKWNFDGSDTHCCFIVVWLFLPLFFGPTVSIYKSVVILSTLWIQLSKFSLAKCTEIWMCQKANIYIKPLSFWINLYPALIWNQCGICSYRLSILKTCSFEKVSPLHRLAASKS